MSTWPDETPKSTGNAFDVSLRLPSVWCADPALRTKAYSAWLLNQKSTRPSSDWQGFRDAHRSNKAGV